MRGVSGDCDCLCRLSRDWAGDLFSGAQLGAQFPNSRNRLRITTRQLPVPLIAQSIFKQHRMPEGVVDAVNNTALGLIQSRQLASGHSIACWV